MRDSISRKNSSKSLLLTAKSPLNGQEEGVYALYKALDNPGAGEHSALCRVGVQ